MAWAGLFAAAPQPPGWGVLFQDDFEADTSAWSISGAVNPELAWRRLKDGSNTVYSSQGEGWLELARQPWGDHRLRSRIKLLRGGINISFRAINVSERYFLHFQGNGLRLSKSVAAVRGAVDLGVAEASFAPGVWHEIEIVSIGGTLKIYVGGVLKLDFSDPDPLLTGGVLFEVPQGGHAELDDVEVTGPAPPVLPSWVKTGGPLGGVGYDIRMRPDNPDVMYVTDSFSGLHISTNGGQTWFASNQGITARAGTSGDSVPIFCVTVDPNNPDVVWTGTLNERGLYRSIDGGKTWTSKVNGIVEKSGISFRGITVDPHDSRVVYAAAEIGSATWAGAPRSGRAFDMTKGVVYKSVDSGDNWSAVWRGDNLARYVVIDPRNSDVIYVSTGIFDREAANSDLAHGIAGGVGILKSKDGGKTWRALNEANGLTNLFVGSLFMHPENPDILLAAAGLSGHPVAEGVYLSVDGGETWKKGVDTAGKVLEGCFSAVEFALSNPSIAYAADGRHFYRSEDGGRTWRLMVGGYTFFYGPPGTSVGQPIDLQVDPRDPNRIFINSYGGGAFLSLDGGMTWSNASIGYTGSGPSAISVSPLDERRVYSIGNSGIFRSDDAGATWQGLMYGADFAASECVAAAPDRPERVLVADSNTGRLWRSNNGGRNHYLVSRHPGVGPGVDNRHGFRAIVFAPSNPRVVYAGMRNNSNPRGDNTGFGVFRSLDGGDTWREANDSSSAGRNINALAVDFKDSAVVFAGTVGHGVLRTRDGGATWMRSGEGLPAAAVLSLAADPADSRILYAGLDGGGLFRSVDGGDHWLRNGTGMDPQAQITSIVIDPVNPQVLYAGDSRSGVFRSQDGGKIWHLINGGLRTRAVTALSISSEGGTLYAATYGEGVFRLDLRPGSETALRALSAATLAPGGAVAPESIVRLIGEGLAADVTQPPPGALPASLGETQVALTDSDVRDHWAGLHLVAPQEINLVLPAAAAAGPATLRVFRQNKVVGRTTVQIERVAPGLFSAGGEGRGVAAASAMRRAGDGSETAVPVFQCSGGLCEPVAIDLGPEGEEVIVALLGTGIRGHKTSPEVAIGGVAATVLGVERQTDYEGLDRVNVRLPRELQGRGDVDVFLKVDGRAANTVTVRIQ